MLLVEPASTILRGLDRVHTVDLTLCACVERRRIQQVSGNFPLKLTINPAAREKLNAWCIRPALWTALALNCLAIFEAASGRLNANTDLSAFFVPPLAVAAYGFAYWLFRVLRDLVVFGFKLLIAYFIVRSGDLKRWAFRKWSNRRHHVRRLLIERTARDQTRSRRGG